MLVFPLTFLPGYDGKEDEPENESAALGCFVILWTLVLIVVPIRAFYVSLASYYGFDWVQMMAMFFGAFLVAALIAPITFGLFLVIYYRFRKLIDAVV